MAARRSVAARRLPRRGCERRGLPRKTASTSPSSPSLGPMSSPTRELAVLDNDGFHSGGGGRTSATNKVVKRARGQPMPMKMAHKHPHCHAPPFVALFLEGKKGRHYTRMEGKKDHLAAVLMAMKMVSEQQEAFLHLIIDE
uniref:Uncharacterized protein n=1 Tax=Oryza glumipatula TaxID=40148 RepID=A0A0D9Y556_9ORYZ